MSHSVPYRRPYDVGVVAFINSEPMLHIINIRYLTW